MAVIKYRESASAPWEELAMTGDVNIFQPFAPECYIALGQGIANSCFGIDVSSVKSVSFSVDVPLSNFYALNAYVGAKPYLGSYQNVDDVTTQHILIKAPTEDINGATFTLDVSENTVMTLVATTNASTSTGQYLHIYNIAAN